MEPDYDKSTDEQTTGRRMNVVEETIDDELTWNHAALLTRHGAVSVSMVFCGAEKHRREPGDWKTNRFLYTR